MPVSSRGWRLLAVVHSPDGASLVSVGIGLRIPAEYLRLTLGQPQLTCNIVQ
jgi:hypothetical protein